MCELRSAANNAVRRSRQLSWQEKAFLHTFGAAKSMCPAGRRRMLKGL